MIVDAVWTSCCLKLSKRSEEHTSELQSQSNLVCRLLLEKKKALTLILLVGYPNAASQIACNIRGQLDTVSPSQYTTRRTLFHLLVGYYLLMLTVSRLKLPVIWLFVSMWLNTLTKSQIWTLLLKV